MTPVRRPACRPLVGLLLLAALAGGCANDKPPSTLLTLPPATLRTPPATAPGQALALAVRRVAVPEYLLTRRVRYRADSSTLAEWPQTYWAERFEVGVTREFIAALRQALPGWTICEGSCTDRVADLSLNVDLAPLDYQRAQRLLTADARITLASPSLQPRTQPLVERRLEVHSQTDTPQGQAQALIEVLQTLAVDTATGLRKLNPNRR
ncbi:PqiC family protein [Caldimonas brevitalea]|uniref:ABC-type transport auxiliary lipoprotein component domain-containing protein n=1 Tax=Caldimonas brevitalea TaxID=413882 RepID=A0A0G3BHZ9_9BURK|nr:ABC-type transport auxiliary lipoprotein family protein [Caldimonas brevitalea]AKJ26981.1 hypothetical protein AAW51_0290 [Caldimonas brevitalea]